MVRFSILLVLVVCLAACATTPNAGITTVGQFSVSPLFTEFYESHGGASVIGVPLSHEIDEALREPADLVRCRAVVDHAPGPSTVFQQSVDGCGTQTSAKA